MMRSVAIYRTRPWRTARLARLYADLLDPGDLAFDIGAHAGNRTRALRRAGARVVALEPQPAFLALLRADFRRDAMVTVLGMAAGPAAGAGQLAVSRLHPTVSSLTAGYGARMRGVPGFGHVVWDAVAEVEVTTLDALIEAHGAPRFVKIDVEGYEAEVLAGLGRPVPWIAFEYLPAGLDAVRACLARLDALGSFRFNLVEGEGAGFALPACTDGPGLIAALELRVAGGRSGDVYARWNAAQGG